jgi:transcription initiation factor IIE alpha subunit
MSEVLQTQKNLEELVKLLKIYFQLDEVADFAINELDDDEIVVEISAVKNRVRKVIERMIS